MRRKPDEGNVCITREYVQLPTMWVCGRYRSTDDTQKLDAATDLGYCRFRCRRCGRRFNERTGTPFNHLEFPTDIVFQVVVFRLLFKLSLRDLVRMFLMRGYEFTHETVREWEERFAPLLAEQLRRKRKGKVGSRWYVDETYLKVKGKWCYLYRAIDREDRQMISTIDARVQLEPIIRRQWINRNCACYAGDHL